jgi:heme A synthase
VKLVNKITIWVLALVVAQVCAGMLNVLLLAPVWMQITHLLLADLVWLSLILLAVETASGRGENRAFTGV